MEAPSNIRQMLARNKIYVPDYQRAYSWETPETNSQKQTHTDVFLSDLEDHARNHSGSQWYLGHFLFEVKQKGKEYFVIDGQQRLTTCVIFLSALFARLEKIRPLSYDEKECYEDMVKRYETIRFATVGYDNPLFIDYVIERKKTDNNGLQTESAKRIVKAYDFFSQKFEGMDEAYLTKMLHVISEAACTTHQVANESEAIQMFIFQNNRGKTPSQLEIIKAQFMYHILLSGGENAKTIMNEVKNRFEKIYRSISSIEYKIDEDNVLIYTQRVFFNSLMEGNPRERINKELAKAGNDVIKFIRDFSYALERSFECLVDFFDKGEKENNRIHSLISLGGIGLAFPFVIKAYTFGLDAATMTNLCAALETLILRHRLIGTRAEIERRINDEYKNFTNENRDITPITDRVNLLKTTEDWWQAYWNNNELERAIQGDINHAVARYLLWRYENYLESKGKPGYLGYLPKRFNQIENPELEHIAPVTEPKTEPQKPHGYDMYDEDFKNNYINCLGNFLLISKPHNSAIGNIPFAEKHKTYDYLAQQREIQKMVPEDGMWGKEAILKRKEIIIKFIMDTF